MAKYFNYFPKTYYTNSNNATSLETVTNIITRFGFESNLKDNISAFYDYEIRDGDTPEIIASKYYDHPERHWIVLLFNDIIDPQFDWPMDYGTFTDYVDTKYKANGGISWAKNINNVHSYYRVSIRTSDFDGSQLIEKFQITQEDYANTGTSVVSYTLQDNTTVTETNTTDIKSYFDYESDLNEGKRTIKLLKPEFINAVEKEFKLKVR
jgi:hypothetical protein